MTADDPETETGAPKGIWLELDLEDHPIPSMVSPPGRPLSAFVGWLGLSAALEGLRSGSEPPAREMRE